MIVKGKDMDNAKCDIEYIINRFEQNGILIDDQKCQQLIEYYSMLVEKNKVMNLTTITEFKDVVEKHFLDSIMLLKFVELNNKSVIDVGTGAGFPGIPLKILCPEIRLTLLDSLNKRIVFLDEVIKNLELKDVVTIHSRAEELANRSEHREKYDVVVSRAVSNLSTLAEYCLPFTNLEGYFYSYKSTKASQEILDADSAIRILGGKVSNEFKFVLDGTDYDRTIIGIQKISNTPKKYPRSGNKPLSNPLR